MYYILAPRCFMDRFSYAYYPGGTGSLIRDGSERSRDESGPEGEDHFTIFLSDCPWFLN